MSDNSSILGIDYGGRTKGTVALAWLKEDLICAYQCSIKEDADVYINQFIVDNKIKLVAIDAPLSLPIVYTNKKLGNDYHYRKADRETKAMSPLFIGGFTANAMSFRAQNENIKFIETFPSHFLRIMEIKKPKGDYNATINLILKKLNYKFKLNNIVETPHQFDAICCLLSGIRYTEKIALCFGDELEGQIFI